MKSPPSVSPNNLFLEAGEKSLADMQAELGDGLFVTDVMAFTPPIPFPAIFRWACPGSG